LQHRVHGMGQDLVLPTWPAITPGEAAAALRHYPAAGDGVVVEWHSPRPFSAAARLATSDGAFILKRHHKTVRAPGDLAVEHAFIAHLAAQGVSVPTILQTADGTRALALGEWTYELHGKAAGVDVYRDRPSWTPFLSTGHAHAAGMALARLHVAAEGFDSPARPPVPLVASFAILPADDPVEAANAYVAARPALSRFLANRPWARDLTRLFAGLGDGLAERLRDRPPLWTHNDWHPSNLLWSADGTVETVFDFGLADRTTALHDLATAIERTAFAWLDLGRVSDTAIADSASALAVLRGYAAVRPLDRAALETVVRLLPLVHLEFALSEIDYFAALDSRDQAVLAWDGYLMGHAEWFLTPSGQDFLNRLRNTAGME